MKFYQINADWQSVRNDSEFWSIKSNKSLASFQKQHLSSGIPRAEDIERLPILVYSDYLLPDALTKGGFYDAFFVSEKLKKLLDSFNLAFGQFYFFEKTNIEWRGKKHRYFWMQSIRPKKGNIVFDPFFDLFLLPDFSLGHSLFCSERLKTAIETANLTAFNFEQTDLSNVSKIEKSALPMPSPSIFEVKFPMPDDEIWPAKRPRPRPADEFKNPKAWCDFLFEGMDILEGEFFFTGSTEAKQEENRHLWRKQKEAIKQSKEQLLPVMKKQTRRAIVSEQFFAQKPLCSTEINASPATSRFFGRPFLPLNFDWPRAANGRALAFIAQINLSELPKNEELPHEGQLLFFMDLYGSTNGWPMEPDRNRVVFFENTEGFDLTDFPIDLPLNADFEPILLTFNSFYDLPDDRWTELFDDEDLPKKAGYSNFWNEINNTDGLFAHGPKLLGWPKCVQGDVGLDLEMSLSYRNDWTVFELKKVEITRRALQWRPLFQFSAADIGLSDQFGDPEIYFLLKSADLQTRRFERSGLVMQGT